MLSLWMAIALVLKQFLLCKGQSDACIQSYTNRTEGIIRAPISNTSEAILCQWTVRRVSTSKVIILTFDQLQLPQDEFGRCSEALLLYGYFDSMDRCVTMGSVCGIVLPSPYTSDHDVWIKLFVTESQNYQFEASFKQTINSSKIHQTTCLIAIFIFVPMFCLFPMYVHCRKQLVNKKTKKARQYQLERLGSLIIDQEVEVTTSTPDISLCGLCHTNPTPNTECSEVQVFYQIHDGEFEMARRKSEVTLTVHRLSSIRMNTLPIFKPNELNIMEKQSECNSIYSSEEADQNNNAKDVSEVSQKKEVSENLCPGSGNIFHVSGNICHVSANVSHVDVLKSEDNSENLETPLPLEVSPKTTPETTRKTEATKKTEQKRNESLHECQASSPQQSEEPPALTVPVATSSEMPRSTSGASIAKLKKSLMASMESIYSKVSREEDEKAILDESEA